MSNNRKKKNGHPARRYLLPAGIIAAVILVATVVAVVTPSGDDPDATDIATGGFTAVEPTESIQIEDVQDVQMDLGKGLTITDVGSYSGIFVEDASNDIVVRILMIVVKNTGPSTIQYGQIQLTDGTTTASFVVTTLPPGESVVLLEKNKMPYEEGKNLTQPSASSVAVFGTEPTLCEDRIQIQALNGVLNVTNISGEDIEGDIVIYYKNAASDMLYGGITYRVTIKGGLKAGEVRQINASHFSSGSRIMWVTIGK